VSALDDLNDALVLVEFHFGPVEPRATWRWREEPFGVCQRCYWDAHTLGPDGRPWHPFCWANPNPPPAFDQWLLRKVREAEQEG
jgi:hypothetical protein